MYRIFVRPHGLRMQRRALKAQPPFSPSTFSIHLSTVLTDSRASNKTVLGINSTNTRFPGVWTPGWEPNPS